MKKKIIYIILLIVVVGGIGGLIIFFNNSTENRDKIINNTNLGNKTITNNTLVGNTTSENTVVANNTERKNDLETTVSKLSDGTLYQVETPIEKVDIVVGDNLYDTQIADMNLNFSQYEGKTIEIEGMYMANSPYTFVGRFSTSNICPTCPQGYSYFEYEWHGNQTPELVDEVTWLKIKGTLTRGEDSAGEYFYIDANSMEIMNERGIDTVNN